MRHVSSVISAVSVSERVSIVLKDLLAKVRSVKDGVMSEALKKVSEIHLHSPLLNTALPGLGGASWPALGFTLWQM